LETNKAKRIEEPKDLGVKIATPKEKLWLDVITQCKVELEKLRNSIVVNEALLCIAEQRLKEEQSKS